jgi:hypothetical protein
VDENKNRTVGVWRGEHGGEPSLACGVLQSMNHGCRCKVGVFPKAISFLASKRAFTYL